MLSSIVTMDATLSMAQESVPSVVLAMLGCMVQCSNVRMYLHASKLACDR